MLVFPIFFALWAGLAHARAARLPRADHRARDPMDPPSTICGDIVDSVNEGYLVFWASDAFDCLRSVPFNDAVALRFIDYYNQTMQFQTTWSTLKEPPAGYQQPAVDLQQGLADLRNNVTSNVYKNQYAFESDLQYLIYQVHDTHVDLSAGVLAAFTFGSPYSIMSASIDGKQEPKLWLEDDILENANNPGDFEPSPIALINGEDPVEYLTRFAAINSQGTVEPHADWNQLMGSPAMDIQGSVSSFAGGATFYPGDELNFTMANGTVIPANWVAVYNELYFTGPLATGGDFYNYFVLGLLPASYNSTPLPEFFNSSSNWEADFYLEDDDSFMTNWTDVTPAYPEDPIVAQEGLYVASDQVVTGYLLPDISTGVLSLPTFNQFDTAKETFAAAIDEFLQNATSHGMQRVVIDLQQNLGGDVMLAFATFKMFFPQAEPPFAGSHKRSHLMADVLGKTFTEYWDRLSLDNEEEVDDKLSLMGREWVVTPRINAETRENFTSWEEYASPVGYGGDSFSTPERYNLSNVNFDMAEFDGWIPVDYVEAPTQEQPYDASNIVILTDGLCASTCSLFVEMMTQAGVRTVVVGGRPELGPMQAASGTRAAAMYTAAALDDDFHNATDILAVNGDYRSSNDSLALLSGPRDTGMWVNSAGFSIRDQVRSADDPEPLQLKYQPADCRIYWTLDNVVNFTRLWSDAAAATWDDPGRCVSGSTSSRLFEAAPPKPIVPGIDFDPSRSGLSNKAPGDQQITSLLQTTIHCNLDDLYTKGYDSCGTSLGLFCRPVNAKNTKSTAGYCVSTCSSTDPTCIVMDQQCKLSKTPLKLESKGLKASGANTAAGVKGKTTSIFPGH
ncbi:peptidase s41 family protein, partial [Apiospora sp. TS-2023a]